MILCKKTIVQAVQVFVANVFYLLSLSLSISLLTIFMGYLTISFLQFSDHAIVKLEWHNICAICINSFSK